VPPLIIGKLVQKQERKGSIAERLLSWGEQHKRGEGDASLADRKYKFGGDEPPATAPVPVPPRPKRETREARGGVSVNKTAGMVAAEKVAAERAKLEQAAVDAMLGGVDARRFSMMHGLGSAQLREGGRARVVESVVAAQRPKPVHCRWPNMKIEGERAP
jgi:hypothetical protein